MDLRPQTLHQVRELLSRHYGLCLPDWVIAARVGERAAALDYQPDPYVDLLATPAGHAELDRLIEALRVGETRFFRHLVQMNAIESVIVPALVACGRQRIRVWSAGCATGEEAYSLAMLLRSALPATISLTVLGSDISSAAIETARAGIYASQAIDHVPHQLRVRYFENVGPGQARVKNEISSLVRYERRNLADGRFPAGFDLILCRNVLIYFGSDARKQVLDGLISSLRDDGFLLVGYSESLREFPQLVPMRTADAIVYRRSLTGAPPA
jgi:chemotaxis protein methyltransferase CheR